MGQQSLQHIILLGITQRCGTNYLFSLLKLHQNIQPMAFPGEDFLLKSTEQLGRYVYETSSNWHAMWGGGINISEYQRKLLSDLGQGLISNFLQPEETHNKTHILSKTPDTNGVNWAPLLFPDSKLIFLVRNPASTIASGRKSFGWTYSESISRWKASADRISNMVQRFPQQTLLVRYEDLMEKKEETISGILTFLEVDPQDFAFSQIEQINILGSSKSRNNDGKIDWSGEGSDAGSVTLSKKPEMSQWLQAFILERCKQQCEALGYPKSAKSSHSSVLSWLKYFFLILPDIMKDAYRSMRKSIQSSNSTYQKWCKNQLGLEIETHP